MATGKNRLYMTTCNSLLFYNKVTPPESIIQKTIKYQDLVQHIFCVRRSLDRQSYYGKMYKHKS